MSSRFEVTKKAINRENDISELKALSERIDVMFLVGNKFTDEEYMELDDMVTNKIDSLTSSLTGANLTDTYKETISNESL